MYMRKMNGKRVLSMVLVIALLMSLVVLSNTLGVAAASGLDNLVLNKTAKLEDDGTYTVQLEAYAKGDVWTETTKQVIPTDLILILDQSGSMEKEISGIPGDSYVEANPTNQELANGEYYYLVDGEYYRIMATKEMVSKTIAWVGDDGKTYSVDELAYSWSRTCSSNGVTYTYYPERPFVASSLKTYTRVSLGYICYRNDADNSEFSRGAFNAADARANFASQKAVNGYTAEFHNDGLPGGQSQQQDNPYYCAAIYIPVSQQEVNTYRYTYTYVDGNGTTVTIGQSATSTEAEIDGANSAISPEYVRETKTGSRLEALQYAANKFIEDLRTSATTNAVDHRVAIIGFASSGSNYNDDAYENTELFVGATQYQYDATGDNAPSAHYTEAFQSVNTEDGYTNLQASINNLDHYGGTYPQYGFEMANGVFENNSATYTKTDGTTGTRNRVIVFMTDGEPGSGDSVNETEANATITNAGISKNTYNAKVFSVAVQESVGTDQADFLKSVSSNNSYTQVTDGSELEGFFATVDEEISSTTTTVTLSENAYLVDRLSEYFVVPDGFSVANNVTVQIAAHAGNESFLTPEAAPSSVVANLSTGTDGTVRGVSVSGFNYVSTTNLVTTTDTGSSVTGNGNKLIVTITGLLAKDSAARDVYVETNNVSSGIWDTDTDGNYGLLKAFPMPTTMVRNQTFVLDYAKTATLNVFGTSASYVDSAADALFSQVPNTTALANNYGEIACTNGALTYTPSTMKWDGYDTFYALGKDATYGDPTTKNLWSKVRVIPANNVYYEDTFTSAESSGKVDIKYSSGFTTVTVGGNTETPNTPVHGGWEKDGSLTDDTTYSDGTAATGTAGATATFTFTGNGVDIYSRTNASSGRVRAELTLVDANGNAVMEDYDINGTTMQFPALKKSILVDEIAVSGDYYQIPTLSFTGLEYGTYKVVITVPASEYGGTTYYLDGVRVYNPMDPEMLDQTIAGAYGDELGAVFSEVRNLLLDAESLTASTEANGVVFIDQLKDGQAETTGIGVATSVIGTYEDYGPKNEVYLAAGQAIAFYTGGVKVSVGLKSPTGASVSAEVTNGADKSALAIGHSTDLYYEITPTEDGLVVIKNVSGGLLSITKLKISGDAGVGEVSLDTLTYYADSFNSLSVVSYVAEPETPDVEVETPAEPEQPEVPAGPAQKDEELKAALRTLIEKLFAGLRGWFN